QRRQQHLVSRAQCDASRTALADRRHELDGRIAEAQAQEQDAAAQRRQKQAQREELARKIAELTAQLDEHRVQIPALTETQTAAQAEADRVGTELREAEAQRGQVMPGLLAVEQELMRLGQSLKEQEEQLTERTFRRTRILERLREIYRIEESEVLAEQASLPPVSEEERGQLAAQIERLKVKLESIGPVSLGSVEEYDELSKRLEFLQTQQADLAKAREDLRQTIQQINRTARAQFRETFAKIQQEFQHYFTRLFNGGQADLILMDEEDVLESGIDIVARPPGKRPQSISLLSGGERALTATALLFALFKVRPSPFCILDEIDAPLDEANVDRFTRVLEEFLNLSQFILITHNKKTITKADCMYGVTMEQAGMSKIVSVKLTSSTRTPPAPQQPSAIPAAA
ncbi:MAG: AAA family ATPase, partial [Candidatus Omnitrophica bacterium]|nr:AAA family ATPase [Candidatus Omnitrophota bacterium]